MSISFSVPAHIHYMLCVRAGLHAMCNGALLCATAEKHAIRELFSKKNTNPKNRTTTGEGALSVTRKAFVGNIKKHEGLPRQYHSAGYL